MPRPHSRGECREKKRGWMSRERGRVTETDTDTQIRSAGRGPGAQHPCAPLIIPQRLRIKSSIINSAKLPSLREPDSGATLLVTGGNVSRGGSPARESHSLEFKFSLADLLGDSGQVT